MTAPALPQVDLRAETITIGAATIGLWHGAALPDTFRDYRQAGPRVLIRNVRVPLDQRRRGAATLALRALLAQADRTGTTVLAEVMPDDSGSIALDDLEAERLHAWYLSLGFTAYAPQRYGPGERYGAPILYTPLSR